MPNVLNAFVEPILKALPKIPQAILALAVGLVILYLLQWLLAYLLYLSKAPRTLIQILSGIIEFILWIILVAVVFQSLGLPQVALALSGSLAIIGIAVGTGATALVQDVIAGLFLAKDNDFNVGYRIKTDDIEGTVAKIDIRKVRIDDDKGRRHVMPLSNLDKSSWVVISRDEKE